MIHLSPADLAIIAGYLVFTVAIGMGLYHSRGSDTEDYLVASRAVTLPAFVATLVATWYGGILGVGEFSYNYGIASWVVFGLPYYVFALAFALFLAPRVRSAELYTIPDLLDRHYGKAPALLGSLLVFVMVSPAPYILILGVLARLVTGWPLPVCVVIGAVLSTFYVANGGLRTDIRVNVFQFALMFLGFGMIVPMAVMRYGGLSFLTSRLPASYFQPAGGNNWQFILVWFLIAMWTLVDPGFHQRCYAAKSGRVARNGILVSILFWFVFDFLTTAAGLYARAALPNLADPKMSYLALAQAILPSGLKGLFVVGILATVMSTVLSYTFLGAVTIGRDLIWRARAETAETSVTRYTRWGLAATGAVAVTLALAIPSVVNLWYSIGTACVPGLLVPVLDSYFSKVRMPRAWCLLAMAAGSGTSILWLIVGALRGGSYWFGLEPMLPGLALSTLVLAAWRVRRTVSG